MCNTFSHHYFPFLNKSSFFIKNFYIIYLLIYYMCGYVHSTARVEVRRQLEVFSLTCESQVSIQVFKFITTNSFIC